MSRLVFPPRLLSVVVLTLMASSASQHVNSSDASIYANPGATKARSTAMFLLDNSGSMTYTSAYDGQSDIRINRLKKAMQRVLVGAAGQAPADVPTAVGDVNLGLSNFANVDGSTVGGRITVPALLSKERAALPASNGAIGATSLYPSTATFTYVNRRDAVGYYYTSGNVSTQPENANVMRYTKDKNGVDVPDSSDRYWYVSNTKPAYVRYSIDIPKGATITSAKLVLRDTTSIGSSFTMGDLSLLLEDVNHALPIDVSNVSARTYISATAAASITNAGSSKNPYYNTTFTITNLLQAMVNRSNWCGLNAVNFKLTSTNARSALSFDAVGSESDQPYLEVQWTVTPTTRAATCMGKRTEPQVNSTWPTMKLTEDYITDLDQMTHRHYLNLEMQRLIANTATPTARAYGETVAYLMGNTTTGTTGTGHSKSVASSKVSSGASNAYQSPLPANGAAPVECLSNGVFTLSDGEPNYGDARALAQQAVGRSSLLSGGIANTGYYSSDSNSSAYPSGWDVIGDLSKTILTGYSGNTKQYPIRSVFVGFGPKSFWDSTTDDDAKNAQKWGSIAVGGGFKIPPTPATATTPAMPAKTETGFVAAASEDDVVTAVQKFFNSFNAVTGISSNGSGVAPGSFGTSNANVRYVYYPLFDPKVDDHIWYGNVKRYKVQVTNNTQRSIVDANDTKILKNIVQAASAADQSTVFNEDTRDFWNPTTTNDGKDIFAGGLVSVLPTTRRLFVDLKDDGTTVDNANDLTQISADLDNTAQSNLFTSMSNLMAPVNPTLPVPVIADATVKATYLKNYVWWLMNYDVKSLAEGVTATNTVSPTYVRTTVQKKRMGGVFHSQPEVITTKIVRTTTGTGTAQTTTITQDDYLIFGTMQGLVHLINASNGDEEFVFAPTELLSSAKTMLPPSDKVVVSGVTKNQSLFYGMDSPWTTWVKRKRVGETQIAEKIYAYGGMRMGGSSYYALNLTGLGQSITKITPKLLFKITNTGDFSDLGQTWSQPVVAEIRVNEKRKRVIIFGGGYDAQYENVTSSSTGDTPTYVPGGAGEKGNAIYIVDADTGALINKISADTGSTTINADMKYSIPSSVKVTDRDADGLIDHIYVGDLGGQVFRVDVDNYPAAIAASGATPASKGKLIRRVVTLAKLNTSDQANGIRFYEPPSFAPISKDSVNESLTTGLVSIASGNMSQPMLLNAVQDYAFAIFDRDVMSPALFSRTVEPTFVPYGLSDFVSLTHNVTASSVKTSINSSTKGGWRYAFPVGDTTKTNGAKALTRTSIIDFVMNATVFDPTRNTNSCSAGIKGASTTYRFCLPYGACGTSANTDIRKTELGAGIGKPLLVGSIDANLSYANDTGVDASSNPTGSTGALGDTYSYDQKVQPMHRWREVTSEKYK